jgi:hypothetical protein
MGWVMGGPYEGRGIVHDRAPDRRRHSKYASAGPPNPEGLEAVFAIADYGVEQTRHEHVSVIAPA